MTNIITSLFPNVEIPTDINLVEFLFRKFARFGDKLATECYKTGRCLTFNQIVDTTIQISDTLESFGVKHRQVVGICAQNCVEYLSLCLAITKSNAICATTNPAYTVDELFYHFNLCQTSYIITDDETREKVLKVSERCSFIKQIFLVTWKNNSVHLLPLLNHKITSSFGSNFDQQTLNPEVAFLFSSSGTTGPPKAVMLSQRNMICFLTVASESSTTDKRMRMYCCKQNDVMLSVFPYFHVGGLIMSLMVALKDGATIVVLPKYQTKDYIACIQKFHPTILVAAPPVFVFLTKSPLARNLHIPTLKHVFIAGATVGKDLVEAVCSKFSLPYLVQGYGLTEVSSISHMTPISDISKTKHSACGVLVPNAVCKVIDTSNGRSLGPFENGEICFKSGQIMLGYLNNPKATNETVDSEGWLHSGDIGYHDHDGYFFIVDRIKELIKVKGYQVAPSELEDILLSHPNVADAAVVSILDEYAGELPRAYVVQKENCSLTEDDLKNYISSKFNIIT